MPIPDLEQQFAAANVEIAEGAESTVAAADKGTAKPGQGLGAAQTASSAGGRRTAEERRNDDRRESRPSPAQRQDSVLDRMERTGEVMNQVFLPGVESREPAQEQSQSGFGNSASFEISVPLP
jgi:hypothetical protein